MEHGTFINAPDLKGLPSSNETRSLLSEAEACMIPKNKTYTVPDGDIADQNYYRYVGWKMSESTFDRQFFSKITVNYISRKVSELLRCLREDGRPVKVSDNVIANVMSSAYNTYRPQLGNGYFMYTQPQDEPRDDMKTLTDIVIQIIYDYVKNEYEMAENNKKLTIWTTLYGDFNEHGLRQHPILRVNDKPINRLRFNMNY